jgi:hypothetical protein
MGVLNQLIHACLPYFLLVFGNKSLTHFLSRVQVNYYNLPWLEGKQTPGVITAVIYFQMLKKSVG